MNKRFLSIILIFFIIMTIFLSSILIVLFDNSNYKEEAKNVLNFLKNKESLNKEIFSDREIAHMEDVKFLTNLTKFLFYISFLITLVLLFILIKKKDYLLISKTLIYSSLISIFLLVLLYLLSLNFDAFFINFHHLFFTNDLWLLPENSMLIDLFPKSFFNLALKRIFLFIIVISSAILINGLILRNMRKNVFP